MIIFTIDAASDVVTTLLGTYNTSGDARRVTLSADGQTAYVADYTSGLQIIDVSTGSSPVLLGTYDTYKAVDVTLSTDGQTAYVADNAAGLKIIDVSTGSNPTLLGSYSTSGFANGVTLSTDGQTAYIAASYSGLQIIDVSTGSSPTLLGTYDTSGQAYDVTLSADGQTAYVADYGQSGLQIIDISTGSSPVLLGSYYDNKAKGVALSADGQTAYVAGVSLFGVDVSDGSSPTSHGGPYLTLGTGNVTLSADGQRAYVPGDSGLLILDITTNSYPTLLGRYDTSGTVYGVTLSADGQTVYVTDGSSGLQIIRLSDPASIVENAAISTVVYNAEATDNGGEADAGISYSLSGSDASAFDIVAETGVVTLKASADYETKSSYSIDVIATDVTESTATQAVTVMVTNVVDESAPVFSSGSTATVVENAATSTVVYNAEATDNGGEADAGITYSLSGTDASKFDIVTETGVVTLKALADYETQTSYSINVIATDGTENAGTQAVTVTVSDVDEIAPVFSSSTTATVVENTATSTVVYNAEATDSGGLVDAGISYSLSGSDAGAFDIVAETGVVTLKASADYETKGSYSINVIATDGTGNSATQAVTVTVTDVDEIVPVFAATSNNTAKLLAYYSTMVALTSSTVARGDVNGMTLSADGKTAYVAMDGQTAYVSSSDFGLQIIDVSTGSSPTELGNYNTAGVAQDVTLSADGQTAYVADGSYGLQIIDVSTGSNPTLLGTYNTSGYAIGVTLSADGQTAYVADYGSGLQIIDVSTGSSPALLGTYDTSGSAQDVTLSADGQTAYVADSASGLQIIDVSTGSSPMLLGTYDTMGTAYAVTLSADGQTAYVADDGSGLQIIDVSTGSSPTLLGTYNTFGFALDVTLSADAQAAYVADHTSGLKIIDVSTGSSPTLLETYKTGDLSYGNPYARHVTLSTDGQMGIVAVGSLPWTSGIQIIELSHSTSIVENAAITTVVYNAEATDNSGSVDAGITYSLSGTDASAFDIVVGAGVVTLKASADYETKGSYSINVIATDGTENAGTQAVTVTVSDVDEIVPVFSSGSIATVVENAAITTVVYNAEATDNSGSVDAGISYSLSGTDASAFDIVVGAGVVTLKASADYETKGSYSINVIATDGTGNSATQAVTVTVSDVDEIVPVFSSGSIATVVENAATSTVVYNAEATDNGGLVDAGISYSLSGSDAGAFDIVAETGVVTLKASADKETKGSYSINVIARDGTGNAATQAAAITIVDINEAPTAVSLSSSSVDENSAGAIVGALISTDQDTEDSHIYSLSGTDVILFQIVEGQIKLKEGLSADYETGPSYELTVTATDSKGLAYTQNLVVEVSDVDEVVTNQDDEILGSSGDDILQGGAGSDIVYGGLGNDTIYITNKDGVFSDYINGGLGEDQLVIHYEGITSLADFNITLDRQTDVFTLTDTSTDTSGSQIQFTDIETVTVGGHDYDFFAQESYLESTTIPFGFSFPYALNPSIFELKGSLYSTDGVYGSMHNVFYSDFLGDAGTQSIKQYVMVDDGTFSFLRAGGYGRSALPFAIAANDSVTGSTGSVNLILSGQPPTISVFGSGGNDYIFGNYESNTITGGAGDDFIRPLSFAYEVHSHYGGALALAGSYPSNWGLNDNRPGTFSSYPLLTAANDSAGIDDSSTTFAAHPDVVDAGVGNDTVLLELAGLTSGSTIDGGEGVDTLQFLQSSYAGFFYYNFSLASTTLTFSAFEIPEQLTLNTGGAVNFENLIGTKYDDHIVGDEGANELRGGAGSDQVEGGSGNDVLYGDIAKEVINYDGLTALGELGTTLHHDSYGRHTYWSYENMSDPNVGGGLLAETYTPPPPYQHAGNDQLFGGTGDDTLYGGAGEDILTGGLGQNRLHGGADGDIFVFSKGDGGATVGQADRILDFEDDRDLIRLDALIQNITLTSGADLYAGHTLVQDSDTGEYLAVIENVLAPKLNKFDFVDGNNLTITTVYNNNTPIVSTPIADQVFIPTTTSFQYSTDISTAFSDPDNDPLTYSANVINGAAKSALPSWLSLDSSTGLLSGTPASSDAGNLLIEVTATDSGGLSVSDQFSLEVSALLNQINTPFTFTSQFLSASQAATELYGTDTTQGSTESIIKLTLNVDMTGFRTADMASIESVAGAELSLNIDWTKFESIGVLTGDSSEMFQSKKLADGSVFVDTSTQLNNSQLLEGITVSSLRTDDPKLTLVDKVTPVNAWEVDLASNMDLLTIYLNPVDDFEQSTLNYSGLVEVNQGTNEIQQYSSSLDIMANGVDVKVISADNQLLTGVTMNLWENGSDLDRSVGINAGEIEVDQTINFDAIKLSNSDAYNMDLTISDALDVLRHIVNLEPLTGARYHAADVDNNGTINISDALDVLRHIVRLEMIETFDLIDDQGNRVTQLEDTNPTTPPEWTLIANGDVDQSGSFATDYTIAQTGTTDVVVEQQVV